VDELKTLPEGIDASTYLERHIRAANLILRKSHQKTGSEFERRRRQSREKQSKKDSSHIDSFKKDPFKKEPFKKDPFKTDPSKEEVVSTREVTSTRDEKWEWSRVSSKKKPKKKPKRM
jgi:hypothetical protein